MNNIFVDLEVFAANGDNSLLNAIAKVEPKVSNHYLKQIDNLYSEGYITEEEYRVLLDEFYDLKDRVLEEVDDKYKNGINFKEVYEINNSNQTMYDYINRMSCSDIGYNIYITFYYNTKREFMEKKAVCASLFPNCKTMGIKFYKDDYKKGYFRKRTNKAEYVQNELGLNDLSGCLLIDKSVSSCIEWHKLNGISQLQVNYLEKANDNEDNKGNQLSK